MSAADVVALVNEWGSLPRQVGARPTPASELVGVADRLHPVFAATDPAERAATVTAILHDTGVRPGLRISDGTLAAGWSVPDRADTVLAAAALALRERLAADPDRIGVCGDRQCADVYVDSSPAGHRRFCSVTCQNRTRVAAFRARRRSTP